MKSDADVVMTHNISVHNETEDMVTGTFVNNLQADKANDDDKKPSTTEGKLQT